MLLKVYREELLLRIMTNLLDNSRKYRNKDIGHCVVSVSREENRARIEFADDGPGVDDECLGKLFDIFYRTDHHWTSLGAYYGYAALPMEPDHLTYLTSDLLDACTVYNYETGKTGPIYDLAKGAGKDPYELFLSGSVSLLTIENPNADTDRELVIFRDSFGSSLAPLLVPGYAKVTLADIRYLPSSQMGKYLTFTDQDVLFLYSAPVLNNSETLK